MEEIALALAALQLAKQAIPVIQNAVSKGDVPVEKQKEILDAYNAFSADLDAAFSGPEWKIEPDEPSQPELPPTPAPVEPS